jgi:hypothetical protein
MRETPGSLLDPRPQSTHGAGGPPLEDDVGGLYKEGSRHLLPRLEMLLSLGRSLYRATLLTHGIIRRAKSREIAGNAVP